MRKPDRPYASSPCSHRPVVPVRQACGPPLPCRVSPPSGMEVVEAGEAVPLRDAVRHVRADRCRGPRRCGPGARHIGGRSSWMPGSSAPPLSEQCRALFRLWHKKGGKEARVTRMRLDNLSPSTTLESKKSLERKLLHHKWFSPVRGCMSPGVHHEPLRAMERGVVDVSHALAVSPQAPRINAQRVARYDPYNTRNPLPPKRLRQEIQ